MSKHQIHPAIVVLLIACATPARGEVPLGSVFTYQGSLTSGGQPLTDTADFQFGLWDAATSGNQVGSTLAADAVSVDAGLFTVTLDFGSTPFTGNARWLEIAVRSPAGSGAFTTLSPRQELTAQPYGLFSLDTQKIRGRDVSSTAPGSDQVLKWDGSAWAPASDADTTYTAGTGLVLNGTQFALDTAYADARYVNEGQASSITSAMLVDGAVTSGDIQDNTITSSDLQDGAVTSQDIQDGAVTSADILDGAVGTADLANSAVTTAKLATGAVTSAIIADLGIASLDLADGAVTTAKLVDAAVTTPKLGSIAGYVLDTSYAGTLVTLKNSSANRITLHCRANLNNGVGIDAYADGLGTGMLGGTWQGVGVEGYCNNTANDAGDAVYGYSKGGIGVHAQSDSSYAVYALSDTSQGLYAASNTTDAIWGWAVNGDGVMGFSQNADGVEGHSNTSRGGFFRTDTGTAYALEAQASASNQTNKALKVTGKSDLFGDVAIGTAATNRNLTVNGNVTISGSLTKGSGSFKIDHPLDPENKYLYHSFVESPDMMNVYNGNVVLDENGAAVVQLPEWFETLNRDFRYQLTAIGAPGPDLYVAQEIRDNRFTVAGGPPGLKVSWQVTGIRQDPYANLNRVPVEIDKPPDERGKYLHPAAYGLSEEMGIPPRGGRSSAGCQTR